MDRPHKCLWQIMFFEIPENDVTLLNISLISHLKWNAGFWLVDSHGTFDVVPTSETMFSGQQPHFHYLLSDHRFAYVLDLKSYKDSIIDPQRMFEKYLDQSNLITDVSVKKTCHVVLVTNKPVPIADWLPGCSIVGYWVNLCWRHCL